VLVQTSGSSTVGTQVDVLDPGESPSSSVSQTDHVVIRMLEPDDRLTAPTRVLWSSRGFGSEEPGKHSVDVRIVWTADGASLGVKASALRLLACSEPSRL
jgi:hypothetical protein